MGPRAVRRSRRTVGRNAIDENDMSVRKLWPEVQVLFDLLTVGETARPFDYCDHCIDPETMSRIVATPPLELNDNLLNILASDLMTTAGDASTFRFYLPALLQVAFDDHEDDVAALLLKAHRAGFETWPTTERAAVRSAVEAWSSRKLSVFDEHPDHCPLLAILPTAALSSSLEACIDQLDALPRRHQALLGARFLVFFSDLVFEPARTSRDSFWEDAPDAFGVVVERLKQNAELYLEFADDEALWHDHDLLMEVLDVWDRERCAETNVPMGATQ